MSDTVLNALLISVGCLTLLLAFIMIAKMVQSGGLTRNGLVGIKTSATLQSDAAWSAGHAAAVPALRASAAIAATGVLVPLPLALLTQPASWGEVAGLAFLVGSVIPILYATFTVVRTAANRAHRQQEEASQQ